MPEKLTLEDYAHYLEANPQFFKPRSFVFDLTTVAMGKRLARAAVPLMEAGSRLSIDELGRITKLYEEGRSKEDEGYIPLLGAMNLARLRLEDEETPKFAVDSDQKDRSHLFRDVFAEYRRVGMSAPDDEQIIWKRRYFRVKNFVQASSEPEAFYLRHAVNRLKEYSTKEDQLILLYQIIYNLNLMRKYRESNPKQLKIRAAQFLPKELLTVEG